MPKDAYPSLDSFDPDQRGFVRALRSDDPESRWQAIVELSDVVDDELARELLRFARDQERGERERGKALIALGPVLEMCFTEELGSDVLSEGGLWDPPLSPAAYREVAETLRRFYHDGSLPCEVRRRALEAAVRAPREWQRSAVATAWSSGDPEWRLTAVFAMGYLVNFEEEILEAFEDDDPAVWREAVVAAGRAGLESLGPRILAVAGDASADTEDRLAAVDALGELAPEGALELLRELAGDRDRELAEAAEVVAEELELMARLDEEMLEEFE